MSDDGYDEDFEDYAEDFESDSGLEAPDQPPVADASNESASNDAWPSLAAAAAVKQKPRVATFTRSLITTASSVSAPEFTSDGISYTFSPAPPPLTDSQRSRASRTLTHSLQHQQCIKLTQSPVYDLLVLPPVSRYQQLILGVGGYASSRAAASQTRQLEQDLQEQDVQTEEVELQDSSCQMPDGAQSYTSNGQLHPSTKSITSSDRSMSAASPIKSNAATGAARLLEYDAGLSEFIEWAVPELMLEIDKATAAAAEEEQQGGEANRPQCLRFEPTTVVERNSARDHGPQKTQKQLIIGQALLQCNSLLAGRTVLDVTCPATPAIADAAAAAISAAVLAAVSSHLLLCCLSSAAMSAEAALKEHDLPGLGCLCVWDLMQQQQQPLTTTTAATAAIACPVQLLVCEGRPSCCCWGTGAGSHLVFAGMQEGYVCCWDLSEPNSGHMQQQHLDKSMKQQSQQQQLDKDMEQQQQHCLLGPRRPSYTTHTLLPLLDDGSPSAPAVLDTVDSIVAVAVMPPSAGSLPGGAAAGGVVCQLISLSSTGNIVLYSVTAGSASTAMAAADLGTRAGSCVWLVKIVEALPLGMEASKPPHLRIPPTAAATHAVTLAQLPGQGQQVLVGTYAGMILKGACLGTPAPPREYVAAEWDVSALKAQQSLIRDFSSSSSSSKVGLDTAAVADTSCCSSSWLGSVVSLSVCPRVADAWLAGFSSGGVALFSSSRSRPVLVWQHLRSSAVVAVRWIPIRPCMFVVLHEDGQLLAFDLLHTSKQQFVMATLQRVPAATPAGSHIPAATGSISLPCSMEVLVHNSCSTSLTSTTAARSSKDIRIMNSSSSSSGKAGQWQCATSVRGKSPAAAYCSLAVGYSDSSTVLYQLGIDCCDTQQLQQEEEQLLQILAS